MLNKHTNRFSVANPKAVDDSNMIPLINIVFLMLIFFMVAGKISSKDAAQYEAPYSKGITSPPTNEYSIIIAADSNLWLDGASWGAIENLSAADWQQLKHLIADAPSLIVKADANLPAQLLDPLLTHLRASGITNIQLAVQATP